MALTKDTLGVEDLARHNPATGQAVQTYNRDTSTGGSQAITKISANDIPLLDPVVVTSAQTPFEALADTQAAKNVEKALAELRKNQYPVKNFSFYGGIEGTGISSAEADINQDVFNQIVSDIPSTGGAIFFPPGNWLFRDGGASNILNVSGKSNITIMGAGFGSRIAAYDAGSGTNLLRFLNSSNITVQTLALDKVGTASGANLSIEGSAGNAIGQIRVFNVSTVNGFYGIVLDGGGGHGNGFWVENCYLDSDTYALRALDFLTGYVTRNICNKSAGSGGMQFYDGGYTGGLVGNMNIGSNILLGNGTQDILVTRTITAAATHKDIMLTRNRLSKGNITVGGLDNVEMSSNELLDGGLAYNLTTMTSARNFRALNNYSTSSSTHGLSIAITGVDLFDYEIIGGRYYTAGLSGVSIGLTTSGSAQNGRIIGVLALDCNQGGLTYSGFDFVVGAGTTLTQNIMHNCISKAATGATTPTHTYGFHSTGAGTVSNNFYNGLVAYGYVTGAATLTDWAPNDATTGYDDLGT